MKLLLPLGFALLAATSAAALAQPAALRPDQAEFRSLYKQLVETNTTLSSGSCTLAAERMAAYLRKAGIPAADLHLFADPAHPKEGGSWLFIPGEIRAPRPC